MDDNDLDIGAVLRNCNTNKSNKVVAPSLGLESMNFENDDWNKFLDVSGTNFDYFSETFPTNLSVEIPNPITPAPIIIDQVLMDQNNNQQLLQFFNPAQLSQQIFLSPLPPPSTTMLVNEPTIVGASQEWINLQQQSVMLANIRPTLTLPMSTPLIQIPIKKNHSTKIIYELMQEELMDDTWIWKKNGEKRIRSSPYPRNYYKCATSKDCKARKQIEKSPWGENLFLVAYSGEHNHPPPTNHRSHASYNVSSKHQLPRGISILPKPLNLNSSASLSPKRSKHSKVIASPIIPTMSKLEIESASLNKNEMMVVATETNDDEGKAQDKWQ